MIRRSPSRLGSRVRPRVTGRDRRRAPARSLPTRLEGRRLRVVRTGWLLVAVSLVVMVTGGFVRAFRQPELADLGTLMRLFTALGLDARLMIAVALVVPFAVAVGVWMGLRRMFRRRD